MPMRIPQPIQIWLNSIHHHRKLKSQDVLTLPDTYDDDTIDNNPLLIGGLENLLLEMIPNISCKPIIKDGASHVAQWICENLIMLYDDIDCMNNTDKTSQLDDQDSMYDDSKLVTIELLPTIVYVYFCLLFLPEPVESHSRKSIKNKPETRKGSKMFGYDKSQPNSPKQDEENFEVTKSQTNTQESQTKSPINHKSDQQFSYNLSPKLGTKIKFSDVHKILIQRARNEYQHIQHQSKKHLVEHYTNEQTDLINIFEVYLLTIYHIYRRNQRRFIDEENLRDNFETIILSNPSIYGDALLYKNDNYKPDNLLPTNNTTKPTNKYTKIKQPDNIAEMLNIKIGLNDNTFNSHNRMHILTTLMKEYNAYCLSGLSKQSKVSLCKLACLFNPFGDNCIDKGTSQDAELGSVDYERNANNMNSPKLQSIEENEAADSSTVGQLVPDQFSPAKVDGVQEDMHIANTDCSVNSGVKRKLKTNRLTGLSENFILEILFALYPILFTEQSTLALEALKSIEARATYELWTRILLLISSMEQDYQRSKLSASKSIRVHKRTADLNELSEASFTDSLVDESKMDSEQLSLASAYCGLWSGLLGKKSDLQQDDSLQDLPEFQDLSGKRLHYVRLAQAKFKRPVVTNSNFKIVKLPDDITPVPPIETNFSKHSIQKDAILQPETKYSSNKWNGSLDDLVVSSESVAPSLLFSREWFKKTLWKDRQPEK